MLDFLEGALLGSTWTDTDFENKKYSTLVALFSTLFWAFFAYLVYKLNFSIFPGFLKHRSLFLSLLLVLFIVSPVISFIYYKLPVILRPVILACQAVKFSSVILLFYSVVVPFCKIDIRKLMTDGMLFFDHTMGSFVEVYTEQYRVLGMFLSGLFLLVVSLVLGLLIIIFLAKLPTILLKFLCYLQRVYDEFILTIFDLISILKRRSEME